MQIIHMIQLVHGAAFAVKIFSTAKHEIKNGLYYEGESKIIIIMIITML